MNTLLGGSRTYVFAGGINRTENLAGAGVGSRDTEESSTPTFLALRYVQRRDNPSLRNSPNPSDNGSDSL